MEVLDLLLHLLRNAMAPLTVPALPQSPVRILPF